MITSFAYQLNEISKHILNAQASIRAPYCQKWFDCPECHAEVADHKLAKTTEMVFMCKKCRKAFRKDVHEFEESDEYCPHCDNHFVSDLPRLVIHGLIVPYCCRSLRLKPRSLCLALRERMLGRMPGMCFFLHWENSLSNRLQSSVACCATSV